MGLTDVMANSEPVHRVTNGIESVSHRVPSHSRESSTSSSVGSTCSSNGILEPTTQTLSAMTLYSDPIELARDVDLESRLEKTRLELEQSRAECCRLAQIRDDVEAEVHELTASLFQEAHVMVNAANVKAAASEKSLKEARMQVEVLQAEVEALKTLVLTSTPSQPNAHLHPQLGSSLSSGNIHVANGSSPSNKNSGSGGLKMFTRHRRGASDCDMKYHHLQREQGDASPSLLSSSPEIMSRGSTDTLAHTPSSAGADEGEIDPVLYGELQLWRRNPGLDRDSNNPFVKRLFDEDADRCLDFPQRELAVRVRKAVQDNAIYIEELPSQTTCLCALLASERSCRYRIKLGDDGSDNQWYTISSLCRNRITAVCDTLTYLRYIQLGLVKSSDDDIYWEVIRLRKRMTLARLGLS